MKGKRKCKKTRINLKILAENVLKRLKKGFVQLRIEQKDSFVYVSVKDNDSGIPKNL
ncbi:hypothetical protein ACRE1U_06350 [Helicobacter himalayensis]|uniref:hypothetical protein n=1 Tax=Helicobacter himalayensis TaxID=1591088 RepID=UPI003D6F8E5E